eukprot:gene5719-5660_t
MLQRIRLSLAFCSVNKSCIKSNLTSADADALSSFTHIEGSFAPWEIALVHTENPAVSFTLYVESATTYTDGGPGLPGFERGGFRADARFYLQGNLAAPMGKGDTVLQVLPYFVSNPVARVILPVPQ